MQLNLSICRLILSSIILSLVFISNANSQALQFTGSQYVNLGNSPSLHITNFTLEAWIRIDGTGTITTSGTGAGGHADIVPIITKGRAEAESPLVDVNFFLGYHPTTRTLLADFEDNATSANHPVTGTTAIGNCWTHVAASYNTANNTWKLYVNGVLDQTLTLPSSFTPQSASNVNACAASALNSGSAASGFLNGRIDEIRIWNLARTDAEILANYNLELTSGTGLVSRWGLNDNIGLIAVNSIAGESNGILNNTPVWTEGYNTAPIAGASLDFNGTSNYVTFGNAPSLNASHFTLETWIRIEGAGTTVSTGTGGLASAIPIIAKGRGEAETPANLNMNYFLGITTGNVLVADFEERSGPNHPVTGTAAIPLNTWTHVAATYDTSTAVWNLYINGVLDRTLDLGTNISSANTSIQHASVGTAMTSDGTAGGFFNGKIDEVRIWNVVRTISEISSNQNNELTSGTGLIGRWGFNEGCGVIAANAISGSPAGTLSSSTGPTWFAANFNSQPPNQPTTPLPADNGFSVSLNPNICAAVSDPNSGNLRVRFFGRKKPTAAGSNFTIIGLPDTQFYTEEPQGANSGGGGHNGIFKTQTQWIANRRVDSNVVFVVQLGDCVQNGDQNQIEWRRADTSMKNIENPIVPTTHGIPYGICVGNHDQGPTGNGDPDGSSTFYNQYFGEPRFLGRTYYGGHYGANNDNHYQLFSANGIDFIHISIEYYPNGTTPSLQPVLDWADGLLKTYSTRKGIISTHNMLGTGNPASFQGPGQKIYDDLKDNPNLILMLAGHVAGEGRRTDVFGGNTVHTIMSDYQSGYTNGGNGYLRIMQFIPSLNLLDVKTYSPYTNTFLTGAGSSFSLPLSLTTSFTLIGETNTASGTTACVNWPGLQQATAYEWYVELYDGSSTTTGPVWTFTTPSIPLPIKLSSFTAIPENNSRVIVSWITEIELNNNPFEIQRSADGVNFTTIASVTSAGNSNSSKRYQFTDEQPLKGVSFYRLKQVDINGSITYTRIERVRLKESYTGFDLYPNPANGNSFTINLQKAVEGVLNIKVIDTKGRLLIHQQINGSNTISINHKLAKGIYTVVVTGTDFKETKKLIIQ